MTSQNHLLSLPDLPEALVSLAENPVVLLLLAVLALAASRAPRDNAALISIAAYFGCTAILNFVFSMAPFYEGLIYIMSCLTAFAMISFLYLSGSYSLSTKLSAIVFLVLCAESGIMALDELNFRAEITLAYLLDPYIQIAADAMLLIIGALVSLSPLAIVLIAVFVSAVVLVINIISLKRAWYEQSNDKCNKCVWRGRGSSDGSDVS